MAAVVALMAKNKKEPHISQQILLWPVTDADFSRDSYSKYGEERFLTTPLMKWMWDNYLPDTEKRNEIYASPFKASLAELEGLPPTLIQLAENDILHDEGLAFGRKLDEAGVPTTITTYNGMIHDYGLLNPIAHVPEVKSAMVQATVVIKNAFTEQR